MIPTWPVKPPAQPAVLCTYVLQMVIIRGDGTIHQVTREGTSVEHDKPSINRIASDVLTEQAAALRLTEGTR